MGTLLLDFPTVWEPNSPLSLVDIAIECCLKNDILLQYSLILQEYKLRDNIQSLPREICERLIDLASAHMRNDPGHCVKDVLMTRLLKIFRDPVRTRLSKVNLSRCNIFDEDLEVICRHNITELNISHCGGLKSAYSYDYLNKLKHSLISLTIGNSVNVIPDPLYPENTDLENEGFSEAFCSTYALEIPNLRKLVIEGIKSKASAEIVCYSIKHMEYLMHLDLSRCQFIGSLNFIQNHKHLVKLILFDVPQLEKCIDAIRTIHTLKYLDISQVYDRFGYYRNPNKVLKSLVESLPDLIYLDISGTNLAGNRIQEREEVESSDNEIKRFTEPESSFATDIPGLKSRVSRPLEFLGLYKTAHEACYRHHIPAKRVAGEASHDQILTAGQVYSSRHEIVQKVLDDLFHMFRFSQCENVKLALDIIIEAMKQHLDKNHIQISGSASLFYIVKSEEKNLNIRVKRTIVKTLLDAMITHMNDVTMIRNGCLTLIHFKIPEDVCFEYDRLVKLLLVIIAQEDQDEFVQRIGVYLLNSIACQVDGQHKQSVGDHGAIGVMLQIIASRLEHGYCDEVMETAWSTLWNVTDETPVNSQRFLEGDGMSLFLKCLRTFPEKPELLRNMMGLLGNVAEVKELRKHLMTDEYLNLFSDLLNSKSDGIEVSYNAAGILSHITSDGPEIWEQHNVSQSFRESVLHRMVKAIEGWNLNAKRNINYRSFEPILRLLYVDHAPEAQYWAVWALANLTRVYPEKYCPLLKEEGGIKIIEKHAKSHPLEHIRELAIMIIQHCEQNDVKLLLDEMILKKSEISVIKDGLLKLTQLKLPENALIEFDRLVSLLLEVIAEGQMECTQVGLHLLSKVIVNVDKYHRKIFGVQGGIMVLLRVVSDQLASGLCDEVMINCWYILCIATEELAANARRFLEADGMLLFSKFTQVFSNELTLLHHVVRTVAHVSEVKEVRPHLISDEYLSILSKLLDCSAYSFEISYFAASVLSNIISESLEVWKRRAVSLGTRQDIIGRLSQAVGSWDLTVKSPRTFNSLRPLLNLLSLEHIPEVQYFAAWTLCNLIRTSPEIYLSRLRDEDDLPIVMRLSEHHQYHNIRQLASEIKERYTWYEVCRAQETIFSLQ